MKGRLRYIAPLVLGCISCQSSTGSGFISGGNDEDTTAALLITTTGGGALSTTAGLLTTAESVEKTPPSLWVEHRREIEVAIARGHGTWIDDLAAELAIPVGLVPRLGETLKRHREELSERLQDEVMVDAWQRTLAEVLCCDPWLLPFAKNRFQCPAPESRMVECKP